MEEARCHLAMSDVFSRAKRSEVMSKIRSRGNRATELRLVSLMRRGAIHGWRRHLPIFGRPDFVFKSMRVAVFVDGCFWHCCPRCSSKPKSNAAFWSEKLAANGRRDRLVARKLRHAGWKVIRIWEHEFDTAPEGILRRISSALGS